MRKSNFILALMFPLLFTASSCCDNEDSTSAPQVEVSKDLPTNDVLGTTVAGAYVEYGNPINDDFAKAVMNRHTFGKLSADQSSVKSVFVSGDNLSALSAQDCKDIVTYILTDRSFLVVNPTMNEWNQFAKNIAEAYVSMLKDATLPENSTEAGKIFLNGLVRDLRKDQSGDIYGLPIVKTEKLGVDDVFSSILYIRGNDVRSYDNDILQEPDSVWTAEYKYDKEGKLISKERDEKAQDMMPNSEANAYAVGQMADDVVEHIAKDKSDDIMLQSSQTRASETDLKDLMQAQQFTHVFRADNYASPAEHYKRRACLVETHYYIWAVYDFDKKTDYYVVHQEITSHNGELGCTSGQKDWDQIDSYFYLSAWAGDVVSKISLIDDKGNAVNNVQVINPQPTTHQGSISHTTGINYSFGANIGMTVPGPTAGLSASVGFSESYTTSTPDYATELNTSGSQINWKFNAANAHIQGHISLLVSRVSHDVVPSCYRNDCTFNQSFIYAIPNPTSARYALDVYTKQDIVNYAGRDAGFHISDKYYHYQNDASYKVELNPPTRYKSDWYMSINVPQGVSQESVRKFLKQHYGKFWKESFTCCTFFKDDTLPVYGVMNDFKKDIMNDLASWKSAGFVGDFSIYVHPSTSSEVLTKIDFTVE